MEMFDSVFKIVLEISFLTEGLNISLNRQNFH